MSKPRNVTRGTDTGAPGLHTHFEMGIEWASARGSQTRVRNLTQWPLDRYYRRKEISRELHEAGNRLYDDFERSHLRQQICMRWEEFIDRGLPDFYNIVSNKDRAKPFWTAMEVITKSSGQDGEGIVWSVVLMGVTAGQYAAHKGFKPALGLGLLKMALAPLPKHYLTS